MSAIRADAVLQLNLDEATGAPVAVDTHCYHKPAFKNLSNFSDFIIGI